MKGDTRSLDYSSFGEALNLSFYRDPGLWLHNQLSCAALFCATVASAGSRHSNMSNPRAPGYLSSRLVGYVTIGYTEPRTHHLGNRSPCKRQK